jgi:hypothetical protein
VTTPSASASPPPQQPAATPVETAPEKLTPLSVVLRTADPRCSVAPFSDGAVIACRSLLLVALGPSTVQDPAWLEGVPEFVNWDTEVLLELPDRFAAPSGPTLPLGTELSMHSGNRNGPFAAVRWDGKRWGPARGATDARRRSVREPEGASTVWSPLPDGGLLAVQTSNEAHYFAPGAKTAKKLTVPLTRDWFMGQIAAASGRDVYFCAWGGKIAHFDGDAWTEVEPPRGRVESCAATSDGRLWVATDTELLQRTATGAWSAVPTPSSARPSRLDAVGERLWIVTDSPTEIWSTKPVGRELSVGTLQLPVPSMPGLSGLDVLSVDAPSVSAAPAAPGTAACTSLVVWLAPRWTPGLHAILAKHREADALDLVEVTGTAPGDVVPLNAGSSSMRVRPSGRPQPAAAALVGSFEAGMRAVTALAPDLEETPPRLLCASPRIAKKIPR